MHTPQHLVIHSVSLKSRLMWMVQWELPAAPAPMHLSILQLLPQFPPVKDSQYAIHYSNNLVIDDVNTTKASRGLGLRIRIWNTSPSFLLTYKHLEPSWYKVRLHTLELGLGPTFNHDFKKNSFTHTYYSWSSFRMVQSVEG